MAVTKIGSRKYPRLASSTCPELIAKIYTPQLTHTKTPLTIQQIMVFLSANTCLISPHRPVTAR